MPRPLLRQRALVVRTYDFGEADRVVVLLTRERGLVRAVAKGVRRAKSRFGSRLQLFVELDVALYVSSAGTAPGGLNQRLSTITEADTRQFLGSGIIEDYERYTAASAVLEAATRLAADDGDPFLFDAALGALQDIRTADEPTLPLDAFFLRAMSHLGWQPSLFDCAACGAPGPHRAFHPGAGGAVCERCRPPDAPTPPPATMQLMWRLLHGYDTTDLEQRLGKRNFAEAVLHAHRMTKGYLQWHMERRFTSLNVSEGDLAR